MFSDTLACKLMYQSDCAKYLAASCIFGRVSLLVMLGVLVFLLKVDVLALPFSR